MSKRLNQIYRISIFVGITAVLCAVGLLTGMLFEFTAMFIVFLVSKELYKHKLHSKSAILCLGLSVSVFILGSRFCPPTYISYTSPFIVGAVIAYGCQYLGELRYKKAQLETIQPKYESLLQKTTYTDLRNLTEDQLRALCKENGLDDMDEEIVVCRIVHRMKGQELYDKIGYSKVQTIRREKHIEQVLGTSLKMKRYLHDTSVNE